MDVSQGSAVTRLRCGGRGTFSYHFVKNLQLSPLMKEFDSVTGYMLCGSINRLCLG